MVMRQSSVSSFVLSTSTYCIIFAILINYSNACSCMLSHPQEHYCSADFVAIVHIKRPAKASRVDGRTLSYPIRVKKEFKANIKAKEALSHGLIWTSISATSCGRRFEPNTRYLITGTVNGEKAWVSLCNFVEEWSSLSAKQRKGFKRLYSMGCKCKVRQSSTYSQLKLMNKSYLNALDRPGFCNWETKWDGSNDCQALSSICVPITPHSHFCQWVTSNGYRACMKRRNEGILHKSEIERETDFIEP